MKMIGKTAGVVAVPKLGPRVREQIFQRTLWAVGKLIPESSDVDGRAVGRLSVAEIASACGLSRKAVRRSLAFLRTWRVLWLRYESASVWEIRFDRRLVKGFILAAVHVSVDLSVFLSGHRAKRERIAPLKATR
jgi:hypothetical protein